MTPPPRRRVAYASHSLGAGNMLAIWLDHRPSESKEQRDPDGWVSGVSGTPYEASRLAELANAPGSEIVKLHGYAAEWWAKISGARKRAASKVRREREKSAQTLFPISESLEAEGRNESHRRAYARGR